MNQEEHAMLVRAVTSIEHLVKAVDEVKQEVKDGKQDAKEGNARLEARIDKLDDRFWKAILVALGTAGACIVILFGIIGIPMIR